MSFALLVDDPAHQLAYRDAEPLICGVGIERFSLAIAAIDEIFPCG